MYRYLSNCYYPTSYLLYIKYIANTVRLVATRTQKPSCVHIENFDNNENMVNLGHKVE